jgi:hypothetical protein
MSFCVTLTEEQTPELYASNTLLYNANIPLPEAEIHIITKCKKLLGKMRCEYTTVFALLAYTYSLRLL